jgi:VirE N-terminal domain
MSNNNFSFFKGGITSLKPTSSINIEDAYALIKSETYRQNIEIIRNSDDKAIVNAQKKKLDYFTFSGIFEQRKADGLISHSSLICLDYDDIENLEKFMSNVYTNTFTLMSFLSPSGKGIKLITHTNESDHKVAWNTLNAYFKKITGIEADKSGIDVCRACFVSYDPNVYYNPNAKIFDILPKKIEKKSPKNEVKIPDSELVRAKKLAERITNGRTDITGDYDTWLKIGFLLEKVGVRFTIPSASITTIMIQKKQIKSLITVLKPIVLLIQHSSLHVQKNVDLLLSKMSILSRQIRSFRRKMYCLILM